MKVREVWFRELPVECHRILRQRRPSSWSRAKRRGKIRGDGGWWADDNASVRARWPLERSHL